MKVIELNKNILQDCIKNTQYILHFSSITPLVEIYNSMVVNQLRFTTLDPLGLAIRYVLSTKFVRKDFSSLDRDFSSHQVIHSKNTFNIFLSFPPNITKIIHKASSSQQTTLQSSYTCSLACLVWLNV